LVTAKSTQDATKTASASINVTVPSSITSVAVSPSTLSLNTTATNQFSATVTGTGSYSSAVTWTAQKGTITSMGLYTAPATGGSDVVTATSVQDTTKTANASLTVAVPSIPSTISSVAVSPGTLSLNTSAQSQFTAAVTGTGSYSSAVTWSALHGSITSGGVYTAPGSAMSDTVTATSVQDGTKLGTSAVTVVVPPVVVPSVVAQPYGSAIAADNLANTALDGGSHYQYAASYRFASPTTANLTSFRIFFITGSGYSAGTYGTIRVIVCPDDGTSFHFPVPGTVLFSTDLSGGTTGSGFVTVNVSPGVAMKAGAIYHVYFINVDGSPASNFISLDLLYDSAEPGVATPLGGGATGSYLNWALLYKESSGGAWSVRPGFTPTLDLRFSDGTNYGNGYIDATVSSSTNVSGANQVRETFTVSSGSGGTRTVNGVRVSLSGSGTPTVRLETGAGAVIATGTMTLDPIYGGYNIYKFDFGSPVTLTQGSTYHLVFSATGSMNTWGLRKGSVGYGFSPQTCFMDGYAQKSSDSGSSWSDIYPYGSKEEDLQFGFYTK
jgi:hypothetical protein